MNAEQLIKEGRGTVVDVRTRAEYSGGHVANSVNIPLQELDQNLDKLSAMKQPLVLCCASGGRSGSAEQFLKGRGFDCVNGGSWLTVNFYANQK